MSIKINLYNLIQNAIAKNLINETEKEILLNEYGSLVDDQQKLAALEINEPKNLRDEFAMAALTGICSNPEWRNCMGETFAHAAYELADEMLAERLVSTDKQDEANPE